MQLTQRTELTQATQWSKRKDSVRVACVAWMESGKPGLTVSAQRRARRKQKVGLRSHLLQPVRLGDFYTAGETVIPAQSPPGDSVMGETL